MTRKERRTKLKHIAKMLGVRFSDIRYDAQGVIEIRSVTQEDKEPKWRRIRIENESTGT